MIFDFRRDFAPPLPSETVPDTKTVPNLTIPRSCPMSGKPPSGVAFTFISTTAAGNVDIGIYALVESSDDTNAVENFAEVQDKPREWVAVNFLTLSHGATFTNVLNLTPGRYYVRRTGGTAASGGSVLGAVI